MRRFSVLHWSAPRAMQAFQVMRVGAVLITSVLLAKSGLSTPDIGMYELMLFLGTTVSFFWVNGLLQGIPPVHARLTGDAAGDRLLVQVFWVFNALAVGVTGLIYLFRAWVTPLLTGFQAIPYLPLFLLVLAFNLPANVAEYVYLLRRRSSGLVFWGLFSFGLQVVAIILPVWLGFGLRGGLLGLLVLSIAKWCWTAAIVFKKGLFALDRALCRQYLSFSVPLLVNVIAGSLVLLIDNWLVGYFFRDETIFAVYRYGSRELPLATALASGMSSAMIARLAAQPEEGRAELRKRGLRLMHLVFPLTIVLMFISEPLFPRLFNPDFAASAPLFNIYLLITASRVLLPNALVLAAGQPGVVLRVGLVELVLKAVLGWWFISLWGLNGLAWSAVIAFLWEKIGLIIWLEGKGIRTGAWLHLPVYFAYTLLMAAAYAVSLFC